MTSKHTILYVEDDLDDLFMVEQAFEKYNSGVEVVHAKDGFEALKFLHELKDTTPLPCLIILDINMPGMDGRETLIRIKQSLRFKDIPVVLFSTSSSDRDKAFARKWNAEFITKPLIYSELEEIAKSFTNLCDFEMKSRA
jgi:CheY-like chemotaxis protein